MRQELIRLGESHPTLRKHLRKILAALDFGDLRSQLSQIKDFRQMAKMVISVAEDDPRAFESRYLQYVFDVLDRSGLQATVRGQDLLELPSFAKIMTKSGDARLRAMETFLKVRVANRIATLGYASVPEVSYMLQTPHLGSKHLTLSNLEVSATDGPASLPSRPNIDVKFMVMTPDTRTSVFDLWRRVAPAITKVMSLEVDLTEQDPGRRGLIRSDLQDARDLRRALAPIADTVKFYHYLGYVDLDEET